MIVQIALNSYVKVSKSTFLLPISMFDHCLEKDEGT